MEPIYYHSKDSCIFCGQAAYKNHNGVDVYICNTKYPHSKTVLIRYGDEGREYYSCPWDIAVKTLPKEILDMIRSKIPESRSIRDYINLVESF